jgi:phosphate transport system substrate-binding protein
LRRAVISVRPTPAYAGSKPSGKVVVAGSSSVTPVMEKLKEAYLAVNPGADIEIQMSDSTTGMTSAIDGICDIAWPPVSLRTARRKKASSPPLSRLTVLQSS